MGNSNVEYKETITTTAHLRFALNKANYIFVQPRFGPSEHWVKITKGEARELLEGILGKGSDIETADEYEMPDGSFGELIYSPRSKKNTLLLG